MFDKKLGCVIFSPPYANSFDYFESYKLELLFGGLIRQSDFSDRKKDHIRNYRLSNKNVITCDIDIAEALSTGGTCYIVVDQSAYVGVIIPTDTILALLAERRGFLVEKISICRKAATSGQQLKNYPYLKNTLRESIVCLKKQ